MFPNWEEDYGQPKEPGRWDALKAKLAAPTSFESLPDGYHGRFSLLSVEDIKFLIACEVDPLS